MQEQMNNSQIAVTQYNYQTNGVRNLIKVVGVGGGGGNAVTKMYQTNSVTGVSFLLCNTDKQALMKSTVPNTLVLGEETTQGLGAGNKPLVAAEAALLSETQISDALKDGVTKMVFITAGMGGGTGTGAAPVVGRIAREVGLLTIGIVTIPFAFEGRNKILQALKGVREMQKHVDALIVINNEKLIEVYGEQPLPKAFALADETLSNAASGISDLINVSGEINLDFADVETTLKDGGVAIINRGRAKGPDRLRKAIDQALYSPLLNNNNNVVNAKRILVNICTAPEGFINTHEMKSMSDFTSQFDDFTIIWGCGTSDKIEDIEEVEVTILASGFSYEETERNLELSSDPLVAKENTDKREAENKIIDIYYGKDNTIGSSSSYSMQPFLLNLEDLDDDDLLSAMEVVPALKRDIRTLEGLRQKKQSNRTAAKSMEPIHTSATTTVIPSLQEVNPANYDIITGF